MTSKVVIDETAVGDLDEILAIAHECRLSPWSRDAYLEELLRPDGLFFCARELGKVIGFAVGRIVPSPSNLDGFDAEIFNVGVLPHSRQQGVGKLLIEHFIRGSVTRSVHSIWLEVRASNHTALGFYQKLQFTVEHRRKAFYSAPVEDALVMQRELSVIQPTNF